MQTAINLGDYVKLGFEQDVEIRGKARIGDPLLSRKDGLVYRAARCTSATSTQPTYSRTWWTASSSSWRRLGPTRRGRNNAKMAAEVRARRHGVRPSARVDNRLDEMPMVAVACLICGARVLARKSSWNQTSVQWNADATARCAERAEAQKLTGPGGRCLFLSFGAQRVDPRSGATRRLGCCRRNSGPHKVIRSMRSVAISFPA